LIKKNKLKANKTKKTKYTTKRKFILSNCLENNLLSVILEENKYLSEFLPTEEVKKSPYFNNVICGVNRAILEFSSKTTSSISVQQQKKQYL
jgi:hypothetical protein